MPVSDTNTNGHISRRQFMAGASATVAAGALYGVSGCGKGMQYG